VFVRARLRMERWKAAKSLNFQRFYANDIQEVVGSIPISSTFFSLETIPI
jgi:hypothetical protein